MLLKITVTTGLTAGTNYPIEKNVIRIGAGSQCDICLPVSDLEAHAATVEFRNGESVIYNRSRRLIRIGSTAVAPGERANWQLGHDLSLADRATLKLEKCETSAKVKFPLKSGTLDSDDPRLDHVDLENQSGDVTGNRSPWISKMLQTGIIVIAVGVVLAWLTSGLRTGATPSNAVSGAVSGPVSATETEPPVVEISPERKKAREQMTEELRFAKAALYREDWERAELALAIIQQKLVNIEDNQEYEKNILRRVKAAHQILLAREN